MDISIGTIIDTAEYMKGEGGREVWVKKLPSGSYPHYLGRIYPWNKPVHVPPVSKIKIEEKKKERSTLNCQPEIKWKQLCSLK